MPTFVLTAFALLLLLCGRISAQGIFPLKDVRAGQKAVGRTVFQGTKIEEFPIEILGVLPNSGPKQSLILARLLGPVMERTGVMQGMSGSPVFIDGKLVGAIALAFNFSKEPIAGIRPIEEMLQVGTTPSQPAAAMQNAAAMQRAVATEPIAFGNERLVAIATPISFSGFSRGTLEHFAPEIRKLGLEPRQAVSGGSVSSGKVQAGKLDPGAMISVQLMSGDMSVAADGTVTHVDGNKIYAFGHEFLQLGETDLPFARASVITLLPNLATSFKISSGEELLGSITRDQQVGVAGLLGKQPALVPLRVKVAGPEGAESYQMQMVRDPVITPFLLQMAVYSVIEAKQRILGTSTISLKGRISFGPLLPVLELNSTTSGDFQSAQSMAQAVSLPLSAAMQGSFTTIRPESIDLEITTSLVKQSLQIDQVFADRRVVKAGETVSVMVTMAGRDGAETRLAIPVKIPEATARGMLQISVSDALGVAYQRYMKLLQSPAATAAEWITHISRLAQLNRLYLRVSRTDAANFAVGSQDLMGPPSSIAALLRRDAPAGQSLAVAARAIPILERDIALSGQTVSGSKTITVEVVPE